MNEWNNCPCWYKYRAVGSKIGGWIFWQLLYIFHASSILLLRCCCLLHYAQCTRNFKLVQWIIFWAFVLRCDQKADKWSISFDLANLLQLMRPIIFYTFHFLWKSPTPCAAHIACVLMKKLYQKSYKTVLARRCTLDCTLTCKSQNFVCFQFSGSWIPQWVKISTKVKFRKIALFNLKWKFAEV